MADKNKFKNSTRHALSRLFVYEEEQKQPSVSVEAVLEEMNRGSYEDCQDKEGAEEEKLQLEPGKTLLGTKRIIDGSESKAINIYYGNYIEPPLTRGSHYIPMKEQA